MNLALDNINDYLDTHTVENTQLLTKYKYNRTILDLKFWVDSDRTLVETKGQRLMRCNTQHLFDGSKGQIESDFVSQFKFDLDLDLTLDKRNRIDSDLLHEKFGLLYSGPVDCEEEEDSVP